jgi:guanyl-specific ribonuclease Sa
VNGKLAKRMRRYARENTVGQADRGFAPVIGSGQHQGQTVAFRVHPETTRGVYRMIKKEHRK